MGVQSSLLSRRPLIFLKRYFFIGDFVMKVYCTVLLLILSIGFCLPVYAQTSIPSSSMGKFQDIGDEDFVFLDFDSIPEDFDAGIFFDEDMPDAISQSCYSPYAFTVVGGYHFAYWFFYRPPSYNAYMAGFPIYAQPYGSTGILVQKRDICLICGCNPVCALVWTYICSK